MGCLSHTDEQELLYYKDQITKFCDPIAIDQVPVLYGDFTEWRPQRMVELMPFLIENDPSPPDFIGELLEEGKVTTSARQFPGSLSSQQRSYLHSKQTKYY